MSVLIKGLRSAFRGSRTSARIASNDLGSGISNNDSTLTILITAHARKLVAMMHPKRNTTETIFLEFRCTVDGIDMV